MSELQSCEAFKTFDRWCRSTDLSRRFCLNKAVSRDHTGGFIFCALLSLTHFLCENALGSLLAWDRLRRTGRKAEAKRVISKYLFPEAGVIRVLTLGKAKQTRLSPSCPLHSLTSQVLRRIRQRASSVMHLKTMKCNPFCLIASLEDPDMFNRPEQRVRLHWHGALLYQNSFKCWKLNC